MEFIVEVGDGGVIEIAGPSLESEGPVPVSKDRVVAATQRRLATVLEELPQLLDAVHDAALAGSNPPNKFELEFNVTVGAEAGLRIVNARTDAAFCVRASWDSAK